MSNFKARAIPLSQIVYYSKSKYRLEAQDKETIVRCRRDLTSDIHRSPPQ
jgi:hypothetical protein